VVTAEDGTTKRTYTLVVTRLASVNANLAGIGISSGTLSPVFASGTTVYTVTVGAETASVAITPTASEPNATVTVNGAVVAPGTASAAINLLTNATTTITIKVTAQDGATVKTYKVNVIRSTPSANANLASLSISEGALSPSFSAATVNYTALVPNSVTAVNITAVTAEPNGSITINGGLAVTGNALATVNLNVGSNVITTRVTAQDGATVKTYKITINRAPSSNAYLAGFTIDGAAISPVFSPGNFVYSVSTPINNSSITVHATTQEPNSTVSGGKDQVINLPVGSSQFIITVMAQDGTTALYYVFNVTRIASTNANLASLSIDQGTLSPAFSSSTVSYTASVSNSVASLIVTAGTSHPNATISINGAPSGKGTSSGSVPLKVGSNLITVKVTADDGTTIKTYKLTITRAASSNNLSMLFIDNGSLSPGFDPNITSYTANSVYVHTLRVYPTAEDPLASVTVNGTAVPRQIYPEVPVVPGENNIAIKVTSADGTATKTYNIKVTVTGSPGTNANLASLTTTQGTLSPAFSSAVTAYSLAVPNIVAPITIRATPVDGYSKVAPDRMFTLNPPVGTSTTNIVVTADDGITTKTYTLKVTRAPSANANLASLTINKGSLSPVFSSATTAYTASVDNSVTSVSVTAGTAEPNGKIAVNGGTATAGTASATVNLVVGTNVITTRVTAQDGTTVKTYKITITRASGPLSFGNNPGLVYTATESYTPESDDVTVQQAVSPNGDGLNDKLKIDGIQSHPDNKLTIIDRNGTLVYEIAGYDNDAKVFDGHSNKTGKLQLPGTYYYVLDYKTGDETKHKTGYLIIKY
jgi:gliding motility-associated-like protein